jgi:hypothetical protein
MNYGHEINKVRVRSDFIIRGLEFYKDDRKVSSEIQYEEGDWQEFHIRPDEHIVGVCGEAS